MLVWKEEIKNLITISSWDISVLTNVVERLSRQALVDLLKIMGSNYVCVFILNFLPRPFNIARVAAE